MNLSKQLTQLVDALQAKIDAHIEEHDAMISEYRDLLKENEALRDQIALLMRGSYGQIGH